METTTLDPAVVANWLDARAALAFQDTEINRMAEELWRKRLGQCACGKPATHLLTDEEDSDWACRVPAPCQRCGGWGAIETSRRIVGEPGTVAKVCPECRGSGRA